MSVKEREAKKQKELEIETERNYGNKRERERNIGNKREGVEAACLRVRGQRGPKL